MRRPILTCLGMALVAACGSPERTVQPRPERTAPSTTTVSGPVWPAADRVNQSALGAMSAEAGGQVSESPLPVLVPTDRQMLAASKVVVGASHYTFASSASGVTLSVQASSAPRESPASGRPGASASAPQAQFSAGERRVAITENEGIRVATWFENGVAYSADVECATTSDPRCRDNAYLLSVVRDLVFVGGRPR